MHEVALAERLLQMALETAEANGGSRITAARVLVGTLSGAEPESLRFAFEIASQGTLAQGCRLEIVRVPTRLRCRACGGVHAGQLFDPCPSCGEVGFDVLEGREMRLESIDLDDAP